MDTTVAVAPQKMLASFWIRFLSDCLDTVFLLLFGYMMSILLRPVLYRVGESGAWVGVLVTAIYFIIFHSAIGHGQSIAKRLFNIQVVQLDGSYLTFKQSFLRYLAFAFIVNNTGIMQSIMLAIPALQTNTFKYVYIWITSLWAVGMVVMVMFHPLKQGLHDLAVSSIVVKTGTYDRDRLKDLYLKPQVKRAVLIWVTCCIILIVIAAAFRWTNKEGARSTEITRHTELERRIEQETAFQHVVCHSLNKSINKNGPAFIIAGFLPYEQFSDEQKRLDEIKNIVAMAIDSPVDLSAVENIVIFVRSGFNIGIGFQFEQHIEGFTPQGERIENFINKLQQEPDNTGSQIDIPIPVSAVLPDNN